MAYIMVFTTLPDRDTARTLVRRLVEARVIACGTVLGGATSVYWWQDAVEEEEEVPVLLKTRRDRWDDLRTAIETHHPYDVPELLAVPVEAGLPAYLDWLGAETAAPGAQA